MSDDLEIQGPDESQVTVELRELVDKFIDGRLSEQENQCLEKLLAEDDAAMDYCAQRMRFHAEMEEWMSPVRVELTQKRHLVVETKKGLATVSKAVSNVVKVENTKHGKSMELPPGLKSPQQVMLYALGLGGLVLGLVLAAIFLPGAGGSEEPPRLAFRNASFEELKIKENSPPFIYTILDWQDYFQSSEVRVCDVKRASEGAKQARHGEYAALMAGGFLTQRLAYTDGSPFMARPGLRLNVSGWAMLESAGESTEFSVASRVVVSAYPSMVQVQPDVKRVRVTDATWQPFEVVLTLPKEHLMMAPTIFQASAAEKQPSIVDEVDITGLQLAISIDNKSMVPLFLDDLKIEVLTDE
ncbi:hypothetical protein [Rubritalea marina]|uniref:hypothetical protein n=1 Tax=Rubritalea marina TaxID=361055 RepID=UPI0003632FC7|nr:hypothetical protein [Rubritalea marina]